MRKNTYNDAELTQIVESVSNCKFVETYRKQYKHGNIRMLKLICECGEIFEVAWNKFNRKDGIPQHQCRKCGIKSRGENQRITNEEYTRIKEELGIKITHLEKPKGRTVGIQHICPICLSEEWYPQPANILSGASTKCKWCTGGYNKLDDIWYQSEKERLDIRVKNVQSYDGRDKPIWHICPECDGGWLVRPGGILQGKSKTCTPCSYKLRGESTRLTDDQIAAILEELSLEWVSGEYEGKESVLTLKCACGDLFDKRFGDARAGWNRCSKCAFSISTGEKAIKDYLDANSTQYIHQQKFDNLRGRRKMPLSYDFGIYDKDILIALVEYDGSHHFKPIYYRYETRDVALEAFEDVKKRDKRKDEYAKTINVPLIRLNGKDYENLDAKLGNPLETIKQYANTEVSEDITRHRNA